jgi:hypothetical protein
MIAKPRALAALAVLAVLVAVPAANATAAAVAPQADPCGSPGGQTVFAQFRDSRNYLPVPDGGFENGATGWTLRGAAVVEGNEPFHLAAPADSKSLSLPAGSSATSPTVCVGVGYPTFRFVAKTTGTRNARLRVEVLFIDGVNGGSAPRVAAELRAGNDWAPSARLALALGRTCHGGIGATGNVAFRFTPVGTADWQIDDLYVDPFARR